MGGGLEEYDDDDEDVDTAPLPTKALDFVARVTYTMEGLSRNNPLWDGCSVPPPTPRSTTLCGNVNEMDGFQECCSESIVSRSSRNDATNARELGGVVFRTPSSLSTPLLLDLLLRLRFLGGGRDMEVSDVAHGNSSIFIF